jgi:ribosomal protein S27AE
MSFKDKPLKKIVADKRVTLDVIHTDVVDKFKVKKEEYHSNLKKLEKLESQHQSTEHNLNIEKLKKEIDNYNEKDELDYYFDTGEILSEYYSQKNGDVQQEKKYISVIDIISKKNRNDKPKKDIINDYMSKIDDNIIPETYNDNIDICPICYNQLILKHTDCLLVCEKCGYTDKYLINSEKTSYKDPPRESSYFAYKRINHFNEWLAQFQAKESIDIPQEIYDGILRELKKNIFLDIKDIKYNHIREILKKLKFNKYYEHIPHIINVLNGQKAPVLSRSHEEQLRMMFKEIQTPFMQHCPDNRKNFLSYAYVLHKFCELIELDELLTYFPLLKSREKLQQQDRIWKDICTSLKWQYIPSI